uniref:Fucolectin tachylectin-4 pentraxin-1 domain-containing protein n=1 Tax=Cyprinus carpio TaxID=7962 RepID=A0A8C1QEU9_CYPCA
KYESCMFLGYILHIPYICFQGNWASRGTVIQSSTSADMFAEKAIDGNRGLQQLDTGCSSTLNQTNPWWRVDLAHIYKVSRVVVTNRNDCCTEQINGAEIRIGNSLENKATTIPYIKHRCVSGESFGYSCGGMEGRYVNLIIPGDMKTLCVRWRFLEKVFYGLNAALWRTASQSSQFDDWISRYAVDGLRNSCSHTNPQTDPWWRVDLLNEYNVYRVAITNRDDYALNGAVIRVGNFPNNVYSNTICAVISTIPSGATANFSCKGIEGRYVIVHIPGELKTLTLCEVEVYGYLLGRSLL